MSQRNSRPSSLMFGVKCSENSPAYCWMVKPLKDGLAWSNLDAFCGLFLTRSRVIEVGSFKYLDFFLFSLKGASTRHVNWQEFQEAKRKLLGL